MKYTQSRLQSIIFRSRVAITSILVFLLILLIASFFGLEQPTKSFVKTYMLGIIGIPAIFTLWLVVFNSGSSRIDEYYVEFTDSEFRYGHLANLDVIPWSGFQKYKVGGFFHKNITVYGANKKVFFELGLFNKAQQNAILKALEEKC